MLASGLPNGAISAAFRVAFNELALDFETTAVNGEKAWRKIDKFIEGNPDSDIPVSKEDFEAIYALSADDISDRVDPSFSEKRFESGIQTHQADTRFFLDKYRDKTFVIEGYENGGKGFPGSYINYYGIGIYTAAGNRPRPKIGAMVTLWNASDILLKGQPVWYNLKQIPIGTKWGEIGYDRYQKLEKR